MNKVLSAWAEAEEATNMLAKVLKTRDVGQVIPFAIPEIGERATGAHGVSSFIMPAYEETEYDGELIEMPPLNAPTVGDLLEDARNEAAKIVAQAEAARERMEEEARIRAEHEADEKLQLAVEEKTTELRTQLAESLARVSALSSQITEKSEVDLVNLALEIARKVVRREVTIDKEVALTLVKISLDKLHSRSVAEVRLNPEDYEYVEANREKLNFRGSLTLVQDSAISQGGCLIHTDIGDIDGRIESQFDEISYGLFS